MSSCSWKGITVQGSYTDSDQPLLPCYNSGWPEQKETWTPRCLHVYISYVQSGMGEDTGISILLILVRKQCQESHCWVVHFHMVEGQDKLFEFCTIVLLSLWELSTEPIHKLHRHTCKRLCMVKACFAFSKWYESLSPSLSSALMSSLSCYRCAFWLITVLSPSPMCPSRWRILFHGCLPA